MKTLKDLQEIVNNELNKRAYEEAPLALFEPMTYGLSVGGKRLRPVMVLLASQMYGGDLDYTLKPAIGLEIFHNFTLLHDDVMDNAKIRRGKPTVHQKWNANVAILSGDAMSIKAYQYIVSCLDTHVRAVLEVFNSTALEVCKGQQMDMDFEEQTSVSLKEYLLMIRYKTAVLFACSLKMGGILAGVTSLEQEKLYELGMNLGMAFQLQDDYLDVYGDVETFGKAIGGDILEKKKTFLLISTLEKLSESEQKDLLDLLDNDKAAGADKIQKVKEIYERYAITDLTKNQIDKYLKMAKDNLDALSVKQENKTELYQLITKLENRSV